MLAAYLLGQHGVTIEASNVEVDGGEVDLLAIDGRTRVVAEVRATTGGGDPIDAVDSAKRRRVATLAGRLGADRVDFIGIRLGDEWLDFHWVPGSV